MSPEPVVGILGWESGNDDTLGQLERIPGDIAHPKTWRFPVKYRRVQGACYETVVVRPNREVLAANIAAARDLEAEGVGAIVTNCGFNAIFQRELADAVAVPLVASSLVQVPLVSRMLRSGAVVGIITADTECLTPLHLQSVGITTEMGVVIRGVEHTQGFSSVRADPSAKLDVPAFEAELVAVAMELIASQPVGALVLECTDLPPFAAAIRKATGLAVFDIVTLAHMVYESLAGDRWGPARQTDDIPF
jgi:Asp/Glu/hydantoin racemase